MKKCTICFIEKDLDNFYKKLNKNGRYYYTSMCKKCHQEYSLKYSNIYRQTEKGKKIRSEYRKNRINNDSAFALRCKEQRNKSFKKHINVSIFNRTKRRASLKGIEFTITKEDIVIPNICPILEIPIYVGTKKDYFNSPSIDRIDVTKGYIKSNIRIISMLANSMKNSANREQLLTFAKNIEKYMNNDEIVQSIENKKSIELQDKELVR